LPLPALHTCLSPALLHLYDLKNTVVVVIDVFRATSTIATALHNGAAKILPVDSVEKCIATGVLTGGITAGERDGKVIPGLKHGNSPLEYPRSFIEGKTLVLTTTNGTKLLHMALAKGADTVITGSFPNISAVCDYLIASGKNVLLGCAGWKDLVHVEDQLFAGAVISRIKEHFITPCDTSVMAAALYETQKDTMWEFLQHATHYHRLAMFGLEADMKFCITPDVANVLCVYENGDLIAR
jgi:2-phosphosulfolactate phosphatase